jgi:flagellar M-ring protein FliF
MAFLDQANAFKERFGKAFGRLTQKQKWMLGGAASTVFALVFTLIWVSAGEGGMVPIQSPVKDLDAAQAELGRYGIASDYSAQKSDLMVPRDKRDRAMLILNAARLLPNGLDNYSFLGDTDFTSTEAQRYERIRVQIEDLLRQTIRAMDGIRQASVRITPASRELLFKPDSGHNKASITVELAGQTELRPEQVLSIASLVSSSYPNLRSEDVFINDTAGRPYVLRGDALITSDRIKVRRDVEANFEDKASRALAGFNAVVAATVEMRLIDETTFASTDYQPRGDEPITETIATTKSKQATKEEKGTAGIRAESQNSNRTDVGRGATGESQEQSTLTETRAIDLENRTEMEKMRLLVDYDKSSLAVSLPETIAEDEAAQASVRTKTISLVSKATGLAESRIAVEFTPRALPTTEGGMVNSLIGDGGWFADTGKWVGYGALLLLIVAAFWVLNGLVRKSTPKPLPELADEHSEEEELFNLPDLPKPGRANMESNLINEQINKLVDDNPQAAANLLKRWMLFNE